MSINISSTLLNYFKSLLIPQATSKQVDQILADNDTENNLPDDVSLDASTVEVADISQPQELDTQNDAGQEEEDDGESDEEPTESFFSPLEQIQMGDGMSAVDAKGLPATDESLKVAPPIDEPDETLLTADAKPDAPPAAEAPLVTAAPISANEDATVDLSHHGDAPRFTK